MGQIEIKLWIVICDRCRKEKRQKTRGGLSPDLPKGWKKVTSGGWGSTNYTNTEWLCENCAKMEKKRKEKERSDGKR